MSDLAKRLRETTHMYQTDCELKMKCADRIEELEENLLSATMDGYDRAKYEYRYRIEELEAKLRRVVDAGVRVRDYFTHHSNNDVYAVQDFNEAIAELKGQNDE